MRFTGTEKQINFATAIVDAIEAAAAVAAERLAELDRQIEATDDAIDLKVKKSALLNDKQVIDGDAEAIRILRTLQQPNGAALAEQMYAAMDRLHSYTQTVATQSIDNVIGNKGPEDLEDKPADAGKIISVFKSTFYGTCKRFQ